MSKIIVTEHGTQERRNFNCDAPETTIGRDPDNLIELISEGVSRNHAVIIHDSADFFLKDIGSRGGTTLNGSPIQENERYLLRTGDVITIDKYHLHFTRSDEIEQSFNDLTDSEVMEVKLLKKVLGALDKDTLPSLEVMNGANSGQRIFFHEEDDTLSVGRDPENDLPIEEYVVSRHHAKILRKGKEIWVQDLGSKNSTFVNNQQIESAPLRDGDRVAFGTIVCIFRNPNDVNLEEVRSHYKKEQNDAAAEMNEKTLLHQIPDENFEEDPENPEDGEDATHVTNTDHAAKDFSYPAPRASRSFWDKLSPTEMGLLWGGVVVFIITSVLLVNLLT